MADFGYRNRRQMEPRPGRRYATEYYQQSPAERERTQQWIAQVVARVAATADETPGGWEELAQPLRRFPREGRSSHYSAIDIMTDMLQQLADGKDIPSGMLGRWNRLMEPHGLGIRMVPEHELEVATQYHELFGDEDGQ